jgi:ParB family chromosome partitioning protein
MGSNHPGKKRGLGRGLGALLINTESNLSETPINGSMTTGIQHVTLGVIQPNPRQPRAHFDQAALEELATSIRTHGILQPLIVTRNPDQAGHYYLVAGERRWRAARLANLDTAPVLVREASPSQLIEWALIENIQRADLNPLEEANAYQTLINEFGLTQDEVAEQVGKSRPAIANAVRLLRLPTSIQHALVANQISAGHARALLPLEEKTACERAFQEIIRHNLNVRQTEALVKRLLSAPETPPAEPSASEPVVEPHIVYLENRFRGILGTRVNLSRNANGSGRLVIHFYDDDDLAQLYQMIAGSDEAN